MSLWSALRRARAERARAARAGSLPSPLALALPLLAASPALIDSVAELMILYVLLCSTKAYDAIESDLTPLIYC